MNITPQNVTLPLATVVNPQTDALRRENNHREVIAQPAAASHSAGEKGVASDKDRARTPGQQNEAINFAQLQKQSEQDNKTISDEQSSQQEQQNSDQSSEQSSEQKNSQAINNTDSKGNQNKSKPSDKELDFVEQQQVSELKRRDLEVRSHEQAHSAAGGAATGSPSFSFQVGPDGKRYAVDGEVSVDLSRVEGNPRATIAKMQKVYSAALAPANPSVQDTRVASSAAQLIAQAQSELLALQLDDPSQAKDINRVISNSATFAGTAEDSTYQDSQEFDTFVNQTLKAQEQVSPTRAHDVDQRADRIEHFYANINHAYEKPPVSRFQLTA